MAPNPACRSYIPQLSPFIDGELPPAERQTVERHLAACADCTGRVADLRAESGLVRLGMEMLADEADFTGFSQKVMARVTPEQPPLWDRIRIAVSEMFEHQRGAMISAAAGVAVVVLGVMLVLRDGAPEGYAGERAIVQEVSVGDNAQLKPVINQTESGNTIIWLVDEPSAIEKKRKSTEDDEEEAEEEIGGPRGGSQQEPPTGGQL